jgi:hypothetical protein
MTEYFVNPDDLRRRKEWKEIPKIPEGGQFDLARFVVDGDPSHPWNQGRATAAPIEPEENPCTLGLHWRFVRGEGRSIAPSHFCGAVWLDDHQPLVVYPKFDDIDIAGMLTEVLGAPLSVTGMEPGALFGCDPGARPIPIPGNHYPNLTFLEVIAYLATLARFVQRHLRQGFNRVSENLVGRVRGRVDFGGQLRENQVRAKDDRACCEFSVMSLDTLENRLLKAALNACSHWLTGRAGMGGAMQERLARWSSQARAALASVPDYRPTARDWAAVRKTGLMRAYSEPLNLARLILQRIHVDARGRLEEDHKVFPFFIDMNRLFEGWVGVCLNEASNQMDAQPEKDLPLNGGRFRFRPDFVVDGCVVDAKYKLIDRDDVDNGDVYQVISYARLSSLGADGKSDDPGLGEAWLALPETPPKHDVSGALIAFKDSWPSRSHTWEWPDFRFGLVRVPLPK